MYFNRLAVLRYSDAKESIYKIGKQTSEKELYNISVSAFEKVGAYKDAAMSLSRDTYMLASQLFENGE